MMFLNLCGFFVVVFSTLQSVDPAFFCYECEGVGAEGTCTFDEVEGTRNDGRPGKLWTMTCKEPLKAGGCRELLDHVRSQLSEEEKKSSKLEKEVKQLNEKLVTLAEEHAEKVDKHAKEFSDKQSKLSNEQRKADEEKLNAQSSKYDQERGLADQKHDVDIKFAECIKERAHLEKEKNECYSQRPKLVAAKEENAWLKMCLAFAVAIPLLGLAILFLAVCCCRKLYYQMKTLKMETAGGVEVRISSEREKESENRLALAQAQAEMPAKEKRDDEAQPTKTEEIPVPTAGSADSSVRKRPISVPVSESSSPVDQAADNGQSRSLFAS